MLLGSISEKFEKSIFSEPHGGGLYLTSVYSFSTLKSKKIEGEVLAR